MPELDGTSMISLASFAVLFVSWLLAPGESRTHVHVSTKVRTEAAAA